MTRDRLPHHRPRFGGFGRITLAAAVFAVALSGCASTAPAPGEEPPAAGSSSAGTPQPGEMVPTGFPEGFDCDAVAKLIPEFTTGLRLGPSLEPAEEYDTELVCRWYDVPTEEGQRVVDLDAKYGVEVTVGFKDDMDGDARERWCSNDVRGKNTLADEILNGHGQCGNGSFSDEDRHLVGFAPYLDMSIVTTCQNPSRACTPVVPDSVTDEAGFTALRTIADHLTANFGFKEAVNVSDATDEAGFVRDWGAAGFPTLDDAPDWYCHPALYDTISSYVLALQGEGLEEDFDWTVADEVNKKPAIPEVTLTMSGGDDANSDEGSAWQTTFTVQVVLGNSMRCISGIEPVGAG